METMDRDDVMEINEELDTEAKESSGGDVTPDTLRILEALLFASDELLSTARIKAILPGNPDARQIRKLVDKINVQLQKERHPFEIVEIGGGYQFRTVAFFHPWVRQIFKEKAAKKLSLQALECLAVIAYKQPVSKAEIEAVRGVVSDGAMKTLLEKKLVTISGRSEKPGRPLQYSTTQEFLRYFGLNKIEDLPRIEEFEAIAREKIEDLSFEELTSGAAEGSGILSEEDGVESEESVMEVKDSVPEAEESVVEINEPVPEIKESEKEIQQPLSEVTESEVEVDKQDEKQVLDVLPEAPEPTAVFEIDTSAISEDSKKPSEDNDDDDVVEANEAPVEKNEQLTMEQASPIQIIEESETTEISVEQRETIKREINAEKIKSQKLQSSGEKDLQDAEEKKENTSDNGQGSEDEELLEVFIPEKTVTEDEEQENHEEKKGFFSKIRKKKKQESDE